VLARYYGTQVADGFFHTFSGWVIYIAASLLLFSVGLLLDRGHRFRKGNYADTQGSSTVAEVAVPK